MLTQNGDTRTRRGHSRGLAAVRLSRLDDERPTDACWPRSSAPAGA